MEHPGTAGGGPDGGRAGIGAAGLPDDSGEQCGLTGIHVANGAAEVVPGGRLHAVVSGAQVDLVEVHLQHPLFGLELLQTHGEQGFPDLPRQGALGVQHPQLDELLGDGGAPLADLAGPLVLPECAQNADGVDARVVPEPSVLRGQHRVGDAVGDLTQRHPHPPLLGEVVDRAAPAIQDGDEGGGPVLEQGGELHVERGDEQQPAHADKPSAPEHHESCDEQPAPHHGWSAAPGSTGRGVQSQASIGWTQAGPSTTTTASGCAV